MRPFIALSALFLVVAAGTAPAQTWSNTAAGTYSWNSGASWVGGVFPNGVGAAANMGVNIVGDQTINLGQAITVGTLAYGDTDSSNTMTIAAGSSLTFSASAGSATFTTSGFSNAHAINSAAVLASPLNATHAGTGLMTFGGVVSGPGSFTKLGTGTVVLSGANTYTGGTVVTAGTLRGTVAGAFGVNSAGAPLTLNGGTLELFADAATTFTNSPVVVAVASTINTSRATAGAGVTHTLGTLSLGAGTLTANAAVANSGTQGLTFGATTLTGNATLTVNNNPATGTVLSTGLVTLGAVGGNFSLTKTGSGSLTLGAAGTFTGGLTIRGGVVTATNGAALGTGTVTIASAGQTPAPTVARLQIAGGQTYANSLVVSPGNNIGVAGTGLLQYTGAGQARWNGSITLNGTAAAGGTFVGSNTAGNELVLGGPINTTNGTSGFSQRSGRVVYAGGGTITGLFSVTDTAFVGATDGIPVGVLPQLGGSGNATLDLATLGFDQAVAGLSFGSTASGNTTNSGTVAVGGRTLTLNGDLATVSPGTVSVSHQITSSGGVIALGPTNRTFTVTDTLAPNDLVVIGAAFTGTGGLTKAGPGTLVLRNVTVAGPLTVNAGTLATGTGGAATGALTTPALTFAANSAVRLAVGTGGDQINGGTVTAAGPVAVNLSAVGTLANGTYPLINYTGTSPGLSNFVLGPFGRTAAALTDTGTTIAVNVTGTDRVIWTGASSGTWDAAASNWKLQSTNAATTFQPGDDVVFDDTLAGNPAIAVAAPVSPGSVTVNATSTNYSFTSTGASQIGGTGGLTKAGASTLTLTGANAYSGPTTVTGGTLVINVTGSIGDGSGGNTLALGGGSTLSLSAAMDLGVNRSLAVGTGGASVVYTGTAAGTVTVGGNITGSSPLVFLSSNTGTATYNLTGTNTGYTGDVTVNSSSTGLAQVTLANQNAAPGGGSITVGYPALGASGNANTLRLVGVSLPATVTLNLSSILNGSLSLRTQVTSAGTSAINGPMTLAGNSIIQVTPDSSTSIAVNGNVTELTPGGFTGTFFVRGAGVGTVNGSINLPNGIVSKTDGGVWTFSQATGNNWLTTQVLSSGSVRLGVSNAFPATANLVVGQGSDAANTLLEMNGFDLTVNGLTYVAGNGNSTRGVGNSNLLTPSTLTINSASNTSFGATGGVTGGILSGNLVLVKAGTGTQTLGGANTYTGGTTVNGGTLTIANTTATTSGTGVGPVTVAGGGTLNGTGRLAPTGTNGVMVLAGGTLKAGTAPAGVNTPGVLTISPAAGGAVTFSAGSAFAVDVQGTTPGNTAANHGQLVVTAGTLDLGSATLNVTFTGYTPSATDTIAIVNFTGASLVGTFNGLPEGSLVSANVLGSGVDYRIFYGTLAPNLIVLAPVPEPATALALSAAGMLAGRCWRRRRTSTA